MYCFTKRLIIHLLCSVASQINHNEGYWTKDETTFSGINICNSNNAISISKYSPQSQLSVDYEYER